MKKFFCADCLIYWRRYVIYKSAQNFKAVLLHLCPQMQFSCLRACYFLPRQSRTTLKLGVAIMFYHITGVSFFWPRPCVAGHSHFCRQMQALHTPRKVSRNDPPGRKLGLGKVLKVLKLLNSQGRLRCVGETSLLQHFAREAKWTCVPSGHS